MTGGCCGGSKACAPSPSSNGDVTHADVSEYYGKTVKKQADLQTSACLVQDVSEVEKQLLGNVHEEILSKFYGCGSPIPPLLKGLTVLDLGCGTGRDVYLVAQLVGEEGQALGIDMTDEQLEVARKHEEWHRGKFGFAKSNTKFFKGYIEDLKTAGIADSSVDVVISNCVINLAPDKRPVLLEVARVLKPGGELFFSDIFADRRIPHHLRQDKVLFGECLSGAVYVEDWRRLMAGAGLGAWGVVSSRRVNLDNPAMVEKVGGIQFFEATIRAIKLQQQGGPGDSLGPISEDAPEDYGQVVTYNGGIPKQDKAFVLDSVRVFPLGTSVRADRGTAAMLGSSRYGSFFTITPPQEHLGLFRGWPRLPASVAACADFSPQEASRKCGALKGGAGGGGSCC